MKTVTIETAHGKIEVVAETTEEALRKAIGEAYKQTLKQK